VSTSEVFGMVHRILAQAVVNCAAQENVIKTQQKAIVELKQALQSHRRKSQTKITIYTRPQKSKIPVGI